MRSRSRGDSAGNRSNDGDLGWLRGGGIRLSYGRLDPVDIEPNQLVRCGPAIADATHVIAKLAHVSRSRRLANAGEVRHQQRIGTAARTPRRWWLHGQSGKRIEPRAARRFGFGDERPRT